MQGRIALLSIMIVGASMTILMGVYLIDRPGLHIVPVIAGCTALAITMLATIGYICVHAVIGRIDEMQQWLVEHVVSEGRGLYSIERIHKNR